MIHTVIDPDAEWLLARLEYDLDDDLDTWHKFYYCCEFYQRVEEKVKLDYYKEFTKENYPYIYYDYDNLEHIPKNNELDD